MWIEIQPITILEIAVACFVLGAVFGYVYRGVFGRKR